jgi:hypothetical protein
MLVRALSRYVSGLTAMPGRASIDPLKVSVTQPMNGS